MFPAGLSTTEQLARLEAALGLDRHEDWGIVNADGARTVEFVDFFERNHDATWSTHTVAEYVDLVLESAGQAVLEDRTFQASCIDRFIATVAPIAPDRIAYWTAREWAITAHLRELGL